jgi:C1A family cysteine protease
LWVTTKRKYKERQPSILPIIIKVRPTQTKIDLSDKFSLVKSQGNTNSCAAFAVVSVVSYIMNKGGILKDNEELSERFLYRETIKYDHRKNTDIGIYLTSALYIAANVGICREEVFPFYQTEEELQSSEINEGIDPSSNALEDASRYKISIYGYIKELNSSSYNKRSKIMSIKKALTHDLPVIICYRNNLNFLDSWYSFLTGYLTNSEYGPFGRHCVVIVGYDDEHQVFKFRNTWDGKIFYWGDKGYGYINYEDVDIITQGWVIAGIKIKESMQEQVQIHRSQFENTN